MKAELSPKVVLGVIAAVVVVGVALLFALLKQGDPAARGPLPTIPFDPNQHAAEMAGPPNPFANGHRPTAAAPSVGAAASPANTANADEPPARP